MQIIIFLAFLHPWIEYYATWKILLKARYVALLGIKLASKTRLHLCILQYAPDKSDNLFSEINGILAKNKCHAMNATANYYFSCSSTINSPMYSFLSAIKTSILLCKLKCYLYFCAIATHDTVQWNNWRWRDDSNWLRCCVTTKYTRPD